MNIQLYNLFELVFLSSPDKYQKLEWLDHMIVLFLIFWRKLHIIFHSVSPIFIPIISHASKVMLKILQARLQQYVNRELPDVQAGFRKGEEPEIKLPISAGSWKKQESSRKASISALLTMPEPLTVWITINCGKFFKRWEYQTT